MIAFAPQVAALSNIAVKQVTAVLSLLQESATIPFIARYRKDITGGLDEVQIELIQTNYKLVKELTDRKAFVEKSIAEQGKLTDELKKKIEEAASLAQVEDIYLPFKPKRKTKAQTAKENGLEPLALLLLQQQHINIEEAALPYIKDNVKDTAAALQGARDIIAEHINEDATVRATLRKLYQNTATIQSQVIEEKKEEAIKFKDYFSFSEPINKIPSHRTLAILRGFLEGYLRVTIAPIEEEAIAIIEEYYVKNAFNSSVEQVKKAIKDAYKRLLAPSLETECRIALKQQADEEAIQVFAENLKQLLLSAPLGNKRILAIDPGYRTGCKVVCLDENGELLTNHLIYVHEANKLEESKKTILQLVQTYQIKAFAIGDGTAGRETEKFIKSLQTGLPVFLVNEDGASVYSASEIAREEFPNHDVTVRGAVSIGRRLMDPLAELVKIDPKSIGVGQYQHDVNQLRLKEKLDATVISCVNKVGVNLNTASKHLLSYVSGIGTTMAENIVKYRTEIGGFTGREQLLQVPRLGDKAFQQCAGFLRITQAKNPLDASAVHPEAYHIVENIAQDLGLSVQELIHNKQHIKNINPQKYINETVGELTIADILKELEKPGLDPRESLENFEFANIYTIEEVQTGMIVPGIVTNLTRFGAFVDIGVKQDGLVHVSEIANRFITDPSEALQLNQKVQVKVLEVDIARKRIALSIKQVAKNNTAVNTKNKVKTNLTKLQDLPTLSVTDALTALKQKFRK